MGISPRTISTASRSLVGNMGILRILLCLTLVIVFVSQVEGKPGRRFGSRRSSIFGSRRSRYGSTRRGGTRVGGTLLKGAALGAGVWAGYQLTKGAANLAAAAINPFPQFPNAQVAFQNWNQWRQQDGMLCRSTTDCTWLDPQMICQPSFTPPQPGNPNWFGGGAEIQKITGECQCPPSFQFITAESRGQFGCTNDQNLIGLFGQTVDAAVTVATWLLTVIIVGTLFGCCCCCGLAFWCLKSM